MAMMDMMRMLVGNPTRSLLVRRRLSSSKDTVMVVKTPYMADSITQGVLASWDKQVGDIVRRDDTVATIETDKVNIPVNTPETGKLIKQHVKVGDTVQVGSDLFEIDTDVNALHNASSSSTPTTPHSAGAPPKGTSKGQEAKDPSDHAALPRKDSPVTPTSPSSSPPLSSSPSSSSSSPSSKDVGTNGVEGRGERVERLSRMRIRIAERMKQAQTTTASLTTFNEVDLSALQRVRAELREDFFAKYAIKLGYMGAFVKACATTLVQMPQVNGELDLPREQIIYRDYVDVSVAVSTPKGLVTPVIKDCHRKSIGQIEQELAAVSERARAGTITLGELQGGTFTVSNGGVFGSLLGTPILNPPQSAILGMHAIKDRPVVVDGAICGRPMMYLALTYDHRIIDGKDAATFLVLVKSILEQPERLLFQ